MASSMLATYFAPAASRKPKYIRNQFGGSLGGPINRDNTFFFADYEGTRSREGITRVTNVPTLLERQGDFSQTRDIFGNPVFIRNPFLPRDPVTGAPLFRCDAGDQTGCFAGNHSSAGFSTSHWPRDRRALSGAESQRAVSKLRLFAYTNRSQRQF